MSATNPPKQPNPPVEKQSKPSPEVQPRKPEDRDYEREDRYQRPATGPGTVPADGKGG